MSNKIKKMKCNHHANNREISEYVFWHTDIRREKHVDIWECKKCKERLDRDIDRDRRIREHNEKQRRDAIIRSDLKRSKRLKKRNKSMEKDIWDTEVKKELTKGLKLKGHQKYLYQERIPKEVLQLKRATMNLERMINKIKQGFKSEEEKKQDEIERLKNPLLECKKHGHIFLKDAIKGGKSRWTGEQRYKCRQCMSDLHRDYYKRKKDYVLKKQALYRKKYPEKVKETKMKSWRRCNGKDKKYTNVETNSITSI